MQDGPLAARYQVTRTDGTSDPGERHATCFLFVLDLDHDPFARAALAAYADAAEATHPTLAADLRGRLVIPG